MRVDRCSVAAQIANKLLVKEEKIIITNIKVRFRKGAIIFSIRISTKERIKLSIKRSHHNSIQRDINFNQPI